MPVPERDESPRQRLAARRRRLLGRILVLVVLLLVSPTLTIALGPAGVPIPDVLGVIASHIPGLDVDITWSQTVDAIVWQTRAPRIVGAVVVGAILGTSGVALQAIVRNPLAEPYVLGVSSGASTGAAVGMIIIGTTSAAGVSGLAFIGALIATGLVLLIGGRQGSSLHLVLGGLAVGFGFQAVTNLIVFSSGSPETSRAVMFWMLGSLGRISWADLPVVSVVAVVLVALMMLSGPVLDALSSGDGTARSVGVEPGPARAVLLVLVSAAVGVAVATAGSIGFVGLVIPHMMRSFVGHSHRMLVLASALASSLLLVWADAFARIAFAPAELPLGVVTGLVGAPILVVLVRRLAPGR